MIKLLRKEARNCRKAVSWITMHNESLERLYSKAAEVTPLPFPVFSKPAAQRSIKDALESSDDQEAARLIQNEWDTLAGGYDSMDLLLSWLTGYKVSFFTESGTYLGDRCRFHFDGFEITEDGASTTDEMVELLEQNPPDIGYNNIELTFKWQGFLFDVSSVRCQSDKKYLEFFLTPADDEADLALTYMTVFDFVPPKM